MQEFKNDQLVDAAEGTPEALLKKLEKDIYEGKADRGTIGII